MRGWSLLVTFGLVAASGCNSLLGLDAPEERSLEIDSDGDGVADSDDTCPFVADPEQSDLDNDQRGDACDVCPLAPPTRDRDGDGVDDACDPCPLGGPHDDDGDGVVDACDICPGTRDAQIDTDADQVGDACDPTRGVQARSAFDAFTSLDPRWASSEGWTSDGEAVTPVELAPDGAPPRLVWVESVGARAAISSTFELASDGEVGVGVVGGGKEAMCRVQCTGADCTLALVNQGVTTVGPPVPLGEIELHMWSGISFPRQPCEAVPAGGAPLGVAGNFLPLGAATVFVVATPGSKVRNADILAQ